MSVFEIEVWERRTGMVESWYRIAGSNSEGQANTLFEIACQQRTHSMLRLRTSAGQELAVFNVSERYRP